MEMTCRYCSSPVSSHHDAGIDTEVFSRSEKMFLDSVCERVLI